MTGSAPRKRIWQTPPDVRLCPFEELAEAGARSFVVEVEGAFFHGFIVRRGGELHGYVDRCPHMGVPLARELDGYLTANKDLIACSWHGALFKVEDGLCVGGPCSGSHLTPWPVKLEDGWILTA